ncbi:hypothetical protein ABEB36_005337 [Hypothenemus hampei]|uniref:Serine/threonine-protein kinase receptor n=1 Tax=Hypothenemus hampei TaxID=57062 RepID=A0ABD1F0X0_HYPHA
MDFTQLTRRLWTTLGIMITVLQVTTESAMVNLHMTTRCEFYNNSCVEQPESCPSIIECEAPGDSKRNHCFVVWSIQSDGTKNVSLKGCLLNHDDCFDQPACVDTAYSPKNNVLYCCCEGDLCNKEFHWDPQPTEPSTSTTAIPTTIHDSSIYYSIAALCIVCICITSVILFIAWRKNQKNYFIGWRISGYNLFKLPTSDPNSGLHQSSQLENRPIQLIELKAQGRFGSVWKAQFKSEEVAVKIFPIQDRQSWMTEKQIFSLPSTDHPNILQYIGAEKRDDNLTTEFWLITAYHENGSLCDYLKANTITWSELCKIAESMCRGLAHLHESTATKSTIAHRDFKSKNVLLKRDLTACIADFGLALTFESGKSCGDVHGQVGTRRYMAPEVLEGAINFNCDSFLRIDMYACGLILWELVSRCNFQVGSIPEYQLPFEEEVGSHPTLEDMQENVVQKKVRPVIQPHWRKHSGLNVLCDTMEECWDHDPEARLSASCVVERIIVQNRYLQPIITP